MIELLNRYSPGEILVFSVLIIIAVSDLISSIRNISSAKKDAEKPLEDVKSRLDTVENTTDQLQKEQLEMRENEKQRLTAEKAEQRAILALLNHSLNGNNTHEMETAKDDLTEIVFGGEK